jgi:hypothetical protein
MKNKLQEKKNYFKMNLTLIMGLSTILGYGQLPDPPPGEVPVDNNISILFVLAIILPIFYLVKKSNISVTETKQ